MPRSFASALVAALILAGCAGPTPYQPAADGADIGAPGGGFAESKIETGRYRVSFSGNSATSRETVESYVLHRAAEITLDAGGDWFAMVASDTKVDKKLVTSGFAYPGPFFYSPRHFRRRGFRRFGHFSFPAFSQVETRSIDRYEASAEILVRRGEKPVGDPAAYDARDVVASIGPTLRRPEES